MDFPDEPLAIHGGPAVFPAGPPSWPLQDDAVQAVLLAAYADGSWGRYHGRHLEQLSAALVGFHGVKYAFACSSGTFAVELALRALNVGAGDEVILAAYDFSGNFRAVEAVGARPVLVDIASDGWCPPPDSIKEAIGPVTKAILVSHLHSSLAAMAEIKALASQKGILLVEDACQAPGAVVEGRPAGTWGDVGVLSFGGSKLLTAGRGGALLTDSAEVFQRAKIFCERGNHAFPLSELQAAVLLPQLEKLSKRNELRRENARRLLKGLEGIEGLMPASTPTLGDNPSYYKLSWRYVASTWGGLYREAIIAALQAEGVAIDAGFRGFASRPVSRCRKVGPLTHSRSAAQDTLLLHHPVLLEAAPTIDLLTRAIQKVARGSSGCLK